MRRIFLIAALLVGDIPLYSQATIDWKTLADVRYKEVYNEKLQAYLYYPLFGHSVREFEGREIAITGYMLPIDAKRGLYILSRNPYASCFFCGNAGPESIIELDLKPKHPKFKMDQWLTIRGILRLNRDDFNRCTYILEQAEASYPAERFPFLK